MSKTTVIYHSSDFDGIFCREIARKFLGTEGVEYIGWNFGDPTIAIPRNGEFVIMDIPIDSVFGIRFVNGYVEWPDGKGQPLDRVDWGKSIWIDHHKTSIDAHPTAIPGYRIDGVAACRLAWQWFSLAAQSWKVGDGATPPAPNQGFYFLPEKQDFIDRKVSEPLAVRLAGEYDVWDKRDERADLFQYGLRSVPLTDGLWDNMFSQNAQLDLSVGIIEAGRTSQKYAETVDAGNMKASFLYEWEGLKFLCLNGRGNSLTFASRDVSDTGHDALLMFYFQGNQWVVSLYHAKHRTDLDLSEIAKKHGGGGHRGACGFTCKTLPFTL